VESLMNAHCMLGVIPEGIDGDANSLSQTSKHHESTCIIMLPRHEEKFLIPDTLVV
jgi:hypothetical protein